MLLVLLFSLIACATASSVVGGQIQYTLLGLTNVNPVLIPLTNKPRSLVELDLSVGLVQATTEVLVNVSHSLACRCVLCSAFVVRSYAYCAAARAYQRFW